MQLSIFVSSDAIRTAFSTAMSAMYRSEVPLYGELIEIVSDVNLATLKARPDLHEAMEQADDLERLDIERHGAIRVGTAKELSTLRRLFAVMGMYPVDYYDLSVAGIPVHSTAFRPVDPAALSANPFRIFTSLLRLDLIEDEALREEAASVLEAREIVSDRAIFLLAQAEHDGGLLPADAEEFVLEVVNIFRWHSDANVSLETYNRLHAAHRLIADIVCFKGPHINHLTPRTLDIDAVQSSMLARGIQAKAVIEGPPARRNPILLRQTSFKALDEPIRFAGSHGEVLGTHTARFGEIEQRGAALTPAGRALYDVCLKEVRSVDGFQADEYEERLVAAFARFPDDLETLYTERLAYFHYATTPEGRSAANMGNVTDVTLRQAIDAGWVSVQPMLYEDFLPVSAAGIFQSNLGGAEQAEYAARSSRREFEDALGERVRDPFELYAEIESASLETVRKELGLPVKEFAGA
jgi:uncharacterized glyoxalase superfamily metalloenzyme YdcJ